MHAKAVYYTSAKFAVQATLDIRLTIYNTAGIVFVFTVDFYHIVHCTVFFKSLYAG